MSHLMVTTIFAGLAVFMSYWAWREMKKLGNNIDQLNDYIDETTTRKRQYEKELSETLGTDIELDIEIPEKISKTEFEKNSKTLKKSVNILTFILFLIVLLWLIS